MTAGPRAYEVFIRSAPEAVWTALTASRLTRLYYDFMEGFMAVESSWEPGTPVRYRTGNGQAQIEGTVVSAKPPGRLEMLFSLRYDPQVRAERASRLVWETTAMGEICRVRVVHADIDNSPRSAQDVSVCMPAILSNLKVLLETGRPRLIKAVVVDSAVPSTVASFWASALGYVMQGPPPTAADNFVGIVDPQGVGPELGFQRVPEPKVGKNRLHLDLHVANRTREVERLVSLGATKSREFENWTIMTDPEGNEFCVVEA